jgi:hypothetical protein
MSKVGKTPKPTVATPKVTTPQGSTVGSNNKLAQAVSREGKGKAVEPDPEEDKDDDGDILIRGILRF